MIVRRATRGDFQAYYGRPPPMTLRGLVAASSTGILGFGGYYRKDGVAVVFSDNRPHMSKRDIVRGARELMGLVRECGLPAVANVGHAGDAALRHYGFEPFGNFYRLAP